MDQVNIYLYLVIDLNRIEEGSFQNGRPEIFRINDLRIVFPEFDADNGFAK